eukprot:COSAG02_NODE_1668_length_11402_cov_21.101743_11_plen_49_part_00
MESKRKVVTYKLAMYLHTFFSICSQVQQQTNREHIADQIDHMRGILGA